MEIQKFLVNIDGFRIRTHFNAFNKGSEIALPVCKRSEAPKNVMLITSFMRNHIFEDELSTLLKNKTLTPVDLVETVSKKDLADSLDAKAKAVAEIAAEATKEVPKVIVEVDVAPEAAAKLEVVEAAPEVKTFKGKKAVSKDGV